MYVSRDLEWTVLQDLCKGLETLDTHPNKTLIVVVSPDYSATVGMHVAHHLSKDGEMLDLTYLEVPYPKEDVDTYRKQFLNNINPYGVRIYQNYENVILVEAGVISGKNYTWITECLDIASIKYYTAALFENTDSIYKSTVVGKYYTHSEEELEFYWEKPNNHWLK
jgi:hypothetical protein